MLLKIENDVGTAAMTEEEKKDRSYFTKLINGLPMLKILMSILA